MTAPASKLPRWPLRLALSGIGVYLVLYVVATRYYPGGAPNDATTDGFSWTQNFWCNLLAPRALNGAPNTARPIALTAMTVLCLSLTLFWWVFPLYAALRPAARVLMRAAGILAMGLGACLFAGPHDLLVNLASGAGLIAVIGTFAGLRRMGRHRLFRWGLVLLLLVALNNLCYYNAALFRYLAVVQKITFLYVLGWVAAIIWVLLQRKAAYLPAARQASAATGS